MNKKEIKWLYNEAQRIVEKAKVIARDGTIFYGPGIYQGIWMRDFDFLLNNAPELVQPLEIKKTYYAFLKHQRCDGSVPKSLNPNGYPSYVCWGRGESTEADSAQYMVKMVYDYYQYTGDIELFASTSSNLKRAMDSMPRSSLGLIWIDPDFPHTGFGFTDCIVKTGNEFFCSLLYWEASILMSAMLKKIGNMNLALEFSERAKKVEKNIGVLWDEKQGAYLAATVDGRKVDIWGNAYMLYIGFPSKNKKDVGKFLTENYDRIIYNGQVRHLLQGEVWEKMRHPNTGDIPEGEYQNGGYWGLASGWAAYSIAQHNRSLAEKLFADLIEFYRQEGIYECVNDRGYRKYEDYVASAVNPLGAIEKLQDDF